jgi:glycosyltransferase involved in cell wall biosynthesis
MAGELATTAKETIEMTLTLVTATLPERANLLKEMLNSVADQTVPPACHIVMRDDGRGFVDTINRAVEMVDTDYFCFVDDDDLLLPNHVETLTTAITESSDIVWTWTKVTGRDWNPNQGYEPGKLQKENYIPSNMAMRTSLWREMAGYRDGYGHPDWDMLKRCEAAGANFTNVPVVTWVYRFHGRNMSQ